MFYCPEPKSSKSVQTAMNYVPMFGLMLKEGLVSVKVNVTNWGQLMGWNLSEGGLSLALHNLKNAHLSGL